MKGTTGVGRQLRQCDDAARDAARRTLPDQILLDAFIQHVKAICVGQLRLEERRETLDQQLIGGGAGLSDLGFGGETKQAMQQRADFLAEQGLAKRRGRRGRRVILARNLLGTLRGRELTQAAKDIAADTGLEHRPVADGQRVAGIYRRSVMLASGRYAMLDDGMGFSLVPWKPVIEQRLGQQLAATVRGSGISWSIGRARGPMPG
jgi:hypothetical protein